MRIRNDVKILLCLAGLASLGLAQQNPVQEHGQLRVQGNHMVDKNGISVAFNGMALYWSQWKPAFYNAECVKWLRDDWGITLIRPSIAAGTDGYSGHPDAEMKKAKAVIQAAIDVGIYVVVDWHETGNGNDHLSNAKTFFTEIAKSFGQYPNVIYETWNEPRGTDAWASVIKPYHETLIETIRAIDPDNLILCGTRSWSQDVDEAAANPITSSTNILYTLHWYASTHKQSYRDKAKKALDKGVALMVTEGGLSEASGDGPLDTAEARRWLDFMKQNYISWTNWSLADLKESSGALKTGTSSTGNWNASQLNPSGTWVRNTLRSMNVSTAINPGIHSKKSIAGINQSLLQPESFMDIRGRRSTAAMRSGRPKIWITVATPSSDGR
jgi:endoglucanase